MMLPGHAPRESAAEGTAGHHLLLRAQQPETRAAAATGRRLVAPDLGSLGERKPADQKMNDRKETIVPRRHCCTAFVWGARSLGVHF
jgi:hypothetical protein